MKSFPFYPQGQMDCGPTCLRMIAAHYGKDLNQKFLHKITGTNSKGTTLLGISDAAEKIGFKAVALRLNIEELQKITLPVILHWNSHHFVVLYAIEVNTYHVADPAVGLTTHARSEFLHSWQKTNNEGVVLIVSYKQKQTN